MSLSNANKSLFDYPQSSGVIFPITLVVSYLSAILPAKWLSGSPGFASRVLLPGMYHLLAVLSGNKPNAMQLNDPRKIVVVLTTLYLASIYIFSAMMSATGQLLGNKEGYRNREPRIQKRHITGMPHRMIAAHEALMEIFPAFAVSAACLLSVPGESNSEPALNALTLHVFVKLFVFVPAYLLDIDVVRSTSHILSVGFLLAAMWFIVVPQ